MDMDAYKTNDSNRLAANSHIESNGRPISNNSGVSGNLGVVSNKSGIAHNSNKVDMPERNQQKASSNYAKRPKVPIKKDLD